MAAQRTMSLNNLHQNVLLNNYYATDNKEVLMNPFDTVNDENRRNGAIALRISAAHEAHAHRASPRRAGGRPKAATSNLPDG